MPRKEKECRKKWDKFTFSKNEGEKYCKSVYETGAKNSLTHHKQIHEIWPGLGLRSKNPS